ncbi:MAG: bifunctional 2-polyprenyl-6-hydroxyphenol methylase/3-demethylubiquinol 3-O-methyltransferase UbiG, partial [Gammaproteobacteria bacterium]
MSVPEPNIDPQELAHFDALASRWWDPDGTFRTLHHINPLRLDFIRRRAPLANQRVLDVGCGGGLLTEAMAGQGAQVTGIDMSEALLSVARLHLLESGQQVSYRQTTVEQFAQEAPGMFDIVTCLEMLEHVPDPASVVHACATLLRPGGHIFLSTLN